MAKTLLMLGGSPAQVVAIKRAKELGYRVVLCDYLPDNPGQAYAEAFYQVSTTDKEAVLDVARKESIDGIVAYGSDPAAPTAAYVAEVLGLPGMPYNTARSFCEKPLFRAFLEREGFNVPKHASVDANGFGKTLDLAGMKYPLIVKPSDGSGSKGVSVIQSSSELNDAFRHALDNSRSESVEIEEFIAAKHEGVIEAEVFVYDGEVVSWGLMRCLRDKDTNPLLPAGYRHPLDMSEDDIALVKESVSSLIKAGKISYGPLNIEMLITADNQLFFLDAGPRNGGNMLPHFFSLISGDDLVEGTLRCAMGEPWEHSCFEGSTDSAWYMHVLHSKENGFFDRVVYSPEVERAIRYENIYLTKGDPVQPFLTAADVIGLVMLQFESSEKLDEMLGCLQDNIKVVVCKEHSHG